MLVVLFYIISFLLVTYLSKHLYGERTQCAVQIVMCFVLLFVFFGLRDLPVLNDTAHYYSHFQKLTRYNTALIDAPLFEYVPNQRFEYGYMIFEKIIAKYVSANPYSIIMISSLAVTIGNLWFLSKYTKNIAMTLFFLFPALLTQYAAIRQGLAIMLFYVAFECWMKGKRMMYFLLVLLAYSFHHSALFLIFFPFIASLDLTKRNVVIVTIATIIITLNVYLVIGYIGYGDSVYIAQMKSRTTSPLAAMATTAIYAGLMMGACGYMHKKYEIPLPQKQIVWAAIVFLCTQLMSVAFLPIGRFTAYFHPFMILYFMYIVDYKPVTPPPPDYMGSTPSGCQYAMQLHQRYIWVFFVVLWLAWLLVILEFRNGWHHLVPYNFFDFSTEYHRTDFGY